MKNPLVLFAGLTILMGRIAAADEFRGLWVDAFGPGFFNAQEVSNLVSDCRKYNFNAVLVEMRARGNAFYMPGIGNGDIRRSVLATNYDALAEIIRQCHEGTPRIEVHCWVSAQYVWASPNPPLTPNHVFNLHPEYFTKDSVGQTFIEKGYFLDPGNPDACKWNHDIAIDIVKHYDLDGFHWDYIRYPNQDSGYNETALDRYNTEFGLTGQPLPKDPKFCEWRRRQVTDVLRWVDADMLEIKPQLVISASVFANYQDAFGYRFQDWVEWNKEGILDICIPMDFSTNTQQIFQPRADFAVSHQGVRRIYLGQGAYENTKENTLFQVNYIRQKGFAGYCVYSYRSRSSSADQTNIFKFLKQNCQPEWVSVPLLPWKEENAKAIVKGTVVSKQNGQAVYNAAVELAGNPSKIMKTEPHGKYVFFEVDPGEHVLSANGCGAICSKKVQASRGSVITVDFVLGN